MKKWISYILFFVSYSPLFFYIWFINTDYPKSFSSLSTIRFNKYDLFLCFSLLSLFMFYIVIKSITKTAPFTYNIKKIQLKNTEFLSYTMTYFFAILSLSMNWIQELIGGFLLLAFIAHIYVLSDQLYTNPIFSIFWYSVYEGTLENSDSIMIIAKNKQLKGLNIPLVMITEKIYFSNK